MAVSEYKSPGFRLQPDYPLNIYPTEKLVSIIFADTIIAQTREALVMKESGYSPAFYIPRNDVHLDLMAKTDHSSYCPFKGHATYWSINVEGKMAENSVWSYENPFEEVKNIRESMSFYESKVDTIKIE